MHADFAEPIDDDDRDVAGIIDEQPLAGGVRLPHRHRHRLLEGSIELAEPRVAVAARVRDDVFVPEDQQRDVLALQFAMHAGPIRLCDAPVAPFAAPAGVERRLQRAVAHVLRQGPGKPRGLRPLQRFPHRRARHAKPAGDLVRRNARKLRRIISRAWRTVIRSAGTDRSLGLPRGRPDQANGEKPANPRKTPGRDHSVMGARSSQDKGGIIPLRGAASSRQGGAASSGISKLSHGVMYFNVLRAGTNRGESAEPLPSSRTIHFDDDSARTTLDLLTRRRPQTILWFASRRSGHLRLIFDQ